MAGARQPLKAIISASENPARAKLAPKMRRSECQGAQATRIGAAAWRASVD